MESEISPANRSLICTLPDDEFASRRKEVRQFVGQAQDVESVPNGLRFTFARDRAIAHLLMDFVLFETECCSAVTYELRFLPPHSQLVLTLHAPPELLDALRSIYLDGRSQTTATAPLFRSSPSGNSRLARICRGCAPFGAVLCSMFCIGFPVVTVSLGALGMSSLRNDKILLPIEVASCAALLWSFWKGYAEHKKALPLLTACVAAPMFLASMFSPRRLALMMNVTACVGLFLAFIADRRYGASCERTGTGAGSLARRATGPKPAAAADDTQLVR